MSAARFTCLNGCGKEWDRDPRLEVPCPMCRAGVGARCKKPSGHRAWRYEKPHLDREQLAVDLGFLEKECPAAPRRARAAG